MREIVVPDGIDPSQIAGTPEWKQRVQAEAKGHFYQGIRGLGQKSKTIEAKAAQVNSYQISGVAAQENKSGKTGDKQEQTDNTTG